METPLNDQELLAQECRALYESLNSVDIAELLESEDFRRLKGIVENARNQIELIAFTANLLESDMNGHELAMIQSRIDARPQPEPVPMDIHTKTLELDLGLEDPSQGYQTLVGIFFTIREQVKGIAAAFDISLEEPSDESE